MDSRTEIDVLKEEIARAFLDVPHPGAPENIIDVPCCPDHDAVAEWSSLHTWQDLAGDLETLDYEPTNWVFFRPEAFRYFVPGALTFIVRNADRDPEGDSWGTRCWRPMDWVGATIVPEGYVRSDGTNSMDEFRAEYLPLFSQDQKRVVIRVLEFLIAYASVETITGIRAAIREIWTAGT
jgi:hypothetical protein